MAESFPRVGIFSEGYDPKAVDRFFEDARRAYEGGVPAEQFSAEQVRQATFLLKRRGYNIKAIDAALSRLEAAFVQRDRANHIAVNGEAAWYQMIADRATTLYPRLLRPQGERFDHPKDERGYRADEVDALLNRLEAFFNDQDSMTADDVRHAVFRPARGKKAYAEGPVDAYLGRAIEILLAVN